MIVMKKLSNIVGKIAGAGSVVYASLVSGVSTFAQSDPLAGVGVGVGRGGDLMNFITEALNLAIILSALIAVGILVFSGIQYIVASGDESKIEKATKGITYSIIGLVIAFIATLIVRFVMSRLLGVN